MGSARPTDGDQLSSRPPQGRCEAAGFECTGGYKLLGKITPSYLYMSYSYFTDICYHLLGTSQLVDGRVSTIPHALLEHAAISNLNALLSTCRYQ